MNFFVLILVFTHYIMSDSTINEDFITMVVYNNENLFILGMKLIGVLTK